MKNATARRTGGWRDCRLRGVFSRSERCRGLRAPV